MFKSIGFVIVLWAITVLMSDAFRSFENAVTAMFNTVEVAAVIAKLELIHYSQ